MDDELWSCQNCGHLTNDASRPCSRTWPDPRGPVTCGSKFFRAIKQTETTTAGESEHPVNFREFL